jgi:hypothetical protein
VGSHNCGEKKKLRRHLPTVLSGRTRVTTTATVSAARLAYPRAQSMAAMPVRSYHLIALGGRRIKWGSRVG